MRVPNLGTIFYAPDNPPSDPADFPRYLLAEFNKIASAIGQLTDGHLDVTTIAPQKPRTGMLRLADGTNWNPGSGQGVYCYYNGAWRFLG